MKLVGQHMSLSGMLLGFQESDHLAWKRSSARYNPTEHNVNPRRRNELEPYQVGLEDIEADSRHRLENASYAKSPPGLNPAGF